MRKSLFAAALTFASLMVSAATGFAQPAQLPQLTPPPPPPVKPYKPVAVTPPASLTDPGFLAFRKQLAESAEHKDRAALTKLVVQKNFFWIQDKDLADKSKPGIDSLAKAVDLGAKDGSGWDVIVGFANEPTAAESPQQKGVFCAPADPTIDPPALEALSQQTQTDPSEWGYPTKDGVEVHATAAANAPVTEKLGIYLVRVLPDSGQGADPNAPPMLHIAMPDGKTGFIDAPSLAPLGGDQMCYTKDGGDWKIAGYYGGVAP
jgi:hypothetical protein